MKGFGSNTWLDAERQKIVRLPVEAGQAICDYLNRVRSNVAVNLAPVNRYTRSGPYSEDTGPHLGSMNSNSLGRNDQLVHNSVPVADFHS